VFLNWKMTWRSSLDHKATLLTWLWYLLHWYPESLLNTDVSLQVEVEEDGMCLRVRSKETMPFWEAVSSAVIT
jgi:hypothetical protein